MAAVREEMGPVEAPVLPVADPGPLGLGAFALTTFVLSAHNAGWAPDIIWVGLALFYGGMGQFLAGMWEFKNRNTFSAAAFGTYGAFWLSLGTFVLLILFGKVPPAIKVTDALGWFLLAFLIFNSYMLIASIRTNVAVFAVFLTLELTELLLTIGFFQGNAAGQGLVQVGGYVGVITAIVAWYTSFAGIFNSMGRRVIVPVGKALWTETGAAGARADMPGARPRVET